MRRGSPSHFRAAWLLCCALACTGVPLSAISQTAPSETSQLLAKAHTQEVRGRMDMAKETWNQVLLIDPRNTEALAGLARAAKSEGKANESAEYLHKLRAINPNDPNIGQVEGMATSQAKSTQLQEAARLAQSGQYDRAMGIQRQMYGDAPPAGDAAIAYYETEAGSPQGRPHAVAGLRALVAKYPQDAKYSITLGKILTYTPSTRPEGRRMLERYPYDSSAVEALRLSLTWDVQNPAARAEIRAYLSRHPDAQLEAALSQAIANQPRGGSARSLNPEQRAEQAAFAQRTAEERVAYNALNAKRYAEADELFRAILARHPQSCPTLAGLGYVRMSQSNFAGAISFLEQAEQEGCKDPATEHSLQDSRFFYTVQVASTALNDNDLFTAEKEFELALKLRPGDPSALLGMGGTLVKAQQPEQAIAIFAEYVKRSPGDMRAWRGLLMAQFGASKYADALDTERRVPPPVKAQLVRDPDYLRTLASLYLAEGREADAQRVFQQALDLPFPNGGQGLKLDVQLQYAALLATVGRKEQAAALYQQALQTDPNNANAWAGLVQIQHQLGHDPEAYQLLQRMPPAMFAASMQEAGFETSVAAIYEGVGHDELAQDVLEKFLAKQQAEGKKLFVPAEVQLAAIYLRRGNVAQAFILFQTVLQNDPTRADAWVGLISAMHSNGHDQDALAQLQQISPSVRHELEKDPNYLETVGSVYAALGDEHQAMLFFDRVQQYYSALRLPLPADVQIQQAWLLYNGHSDAALYQQLMVLGGRQDMTDKQRLTVQEIWTDWAVRRASQNVAAGDYHRAIAILNATAKSFPGNPVVIKALASGYASAGMAKEAVAIFRAQDMSNASAADYSAAAGAALAAADLRDAEYWLRFGLQRYPRDSRLLMLAAKFEQARGDANRAAEYYRATLAAEPPANPGAALATELSHPAPSLPAPLPSANQPQDLATLLSQPDRAAHTGDQQQASRPYLPSFNSSDPTSLPMGVAPNGQGPAWGNPQGGDIYPPAQPSAPQSPALKDYVPHAELRSEPTDGVHVAEKVIYLHPSHEMEAKYGPYVSYDPSRGVPHFISSHEHLGDGLLVTASAGKEPITALMRAAAYIPVQQTSQDAVPVVPYIPAVSQPAKKIVPRQSPRARAAAIRQNQAQGQSGLTGQSHPPAEDYSAPHNAASTLRNAQFSSQPYDPAQVQSGQQVAQPPTPPPTSPQSTIQAPVQLAPAYRSVPVYPPASTYQAPSTPQQQSIPDTSGQQYPQPGIGVTANGYRPRRKVKIAKQATTPSALPAPVVEAAPVQQAPAMSYPSAVQPLTNLGSPQAALPYQMGQPPSDYDLQQRNLPPLRGYFDPRADERTPMTPRQQAELALATIEGNYSGWVGGTAIGHYRSGTAGVDRLGSLEVPIEVSLVAGKTFRLNVIPKAVFLTSGQLDTVNNNLGSAPILGTLPGNAATPPAQQFASGVGGEVQLVTNTFSVAAGVTPYQFLVNNVIGRGQWRPLNSHFLIYGGRDPVRETQLSYAGMRDPGSASAVYSGNVWGGVVTTGGGVRFDAGGERTGVYAVAEGAQLTGFHVLDNYKFDGTLGMYFRVNTWADYGSLNIGGLFYGEHFQHNERGETYGLGGYFSPEAYFLATVPITFNGHYGKNLHYMINTSVGVQTFEEDSQNYFPLDPALQTSAFSACTVVQLTTHTCGQLPVNSNTGFNYAFDSEISYHPSEHWYVGGFLSANNTNNYNSATGGFFARYTFRPQVASPDGPTGLFPVEGFRPLQVP